MVCFILFYILIFIWKENNTILIFNVNINTYKINELSIKFLLVILNMLTCHSALTGTNQ